MKDARAWLDGVLSGPASTGPYSADELGHIAESLGPHKARFAHIADAVDDLAREYLARKAYLANPVSKLYRAHRPRGTVLRSQLDKVSRSREPSRFIAALDAMHDSLWWGIYCRTEGQAKADLWPFICADRAPDAATSLKHNQPIRVAAAEFQKTMPRGKTGNRQNILETWFISRLAAIYEVVTGKHPSTRAAGFGNNADRRAGPFIRFIKACLDPIKEMPIDVLGEIAHATLRTKAPKRCKAA